MPKKRHFLLKQLWIFHGLASLLILQAFDFTWQQTICKRKHKVLSNNFFKDSFLPQLTFLSLGGGWARCSHAHMLKKSTVLYYVLFYACNFIKKRLQHRCFSVNIAKFLRPPILKKICKRLLLEKSNCRKVPSIFAKRF